MGKPRAFKSGAEFGAWLAKHHASEEALVVRLFKTSANDKGMGYKAALDEALCWGWIDGVRHALDEESFTVRFSPRKAKSNWSAINIRRVGELEAEGRMKEPGLAVFRQREEKRSRVYSFENKPAKLDAAHEKRFRANKAAWAFFQEQPPGYQRTVCFWVMSAKKPETQERRLDVLIDCCAKKTRIPALAPK
jgi:uncharacterized protein YdeI (YjbR/CyaY-like superfamily)